MNISRRTLMSLGIGAAAVGAAGCSVTGASTSSPTEASSGPISGTVNALLMKQAGWTESDWAGVIKKFEAANPGVKVNPTFVAYEALHDKIVSSAAAGTYDMILIDVIWPAEFAVKKMITDVTDRIPASWKTDMQGSSIQASTYEGRFYAGPAFPSTKLFYFNKSLMAKAGVSQSDITTWKGVMAAAHTMMSKGVCAHPLAWSWAQAEAVICDFAQLLGAFGGTFTDDSGKLNFNNQPGVDTLQFMVDTLKDGSTLSGSTTFLEDDVSKAMQSGSIAFSLNWESTFRDLNDPSSSQVVGKVGVSATPKGTSGKRPGVNGAMAYSVTTGSKNPEAAWKLIEFACSAAVQDPLAKSQMPNWKASFTNPDVVKVNPEVFAACKVAYADSILRPQVVNYNDVSTILQVEIQNALLGKKPVQTALDDAVSKGNKSLQ